ncbi:hypothetical protein BCR33DRAFT_788829 [Rhizoclosmatium globosum]|uniref:Uncharacterized protein n=1 Tax=Rhizoclosmatium globosum TaxID=329046 RepID=A0A1Y2BV18_9FUNG|nr:hypothetical protein BCR33DRAFT_788829 [Rhizoclosmatium globosum]|eukprot:ORY38599.1 hypothetical protein BCR33DRAFT_788829 [Rhizoclosmatium globosum]
MKPDQVYHSQLPQFFVPSVNPFAWLMEAEEDIRDIRGPDRTKAKEWRNLIFGPDTGSEDFRQTFRAILALPAAINWAQANCSGLLEVGLATEKELLGIRLPDVASDELTNIASKFAELGRLPNVGLDMDSSFSLIEAPGEGPDVPGGPYIKKDFWFHKQFYAIWLLAVCDSDMLF